MDENQEARTKELSKRMIECLAKGDRAGFMDALVDMGRAELTPDVAEYLADYCVVLTPMWLPTLAEDVTLPVDNPLDALVARYVHDYLKACRRNDNAAMEECLESLIAGADDDFEGPRRAAMFINYLAVVAGLMERQADTAERAGVSVVGVEGPYGTRLFR